MAEPKNVARTHLEALRELRERADSILALSDEAFEFFCADVAAGRVDSVPTLIYRLRRRSRGFRVNRRLLQLLRAEEAIVDRVDRAELVERLHAGRLTGHQCDHWLATRRREVPTIDGYPIWLAATLVDVVD